MYNLQAKDKAFLDKLFDTQVTEERPWVIKYKGKIIVTRKNGLSSFGNKQSAKLSLNHHCGIWLGSKPTRWDPTSLQDVNLEFIKEFGDHWPNGRYDNGHPVGRFNGPELANFLIKEGLVTIEKVTP